MTTKTTSLVPYKAPSGQTASYRNPNRGRDIPGSRPTAVILDMDGTLDVAGKPGKPGMRWARRMHRAGHVLIVVTARTQEYEYERTHAWLIRNMRDKMKPMPFVGPFCRSKDDMRFACDFKKAVYDMLSNTYDIIGAIDDDRWCLQKWRTIPDFIVEECHPLRWSTAAIVNRGASGYAASNWKSNGSVNDMLRNKGGYSWKDDRACRGCGRWYTHSADCTEKIDGRLDLLDVDLDAGVDAALDALEQSPNSFWDNYDQWEDGRR